MNDSFYMMVILISCMLGFVGLFLGAKCATCGKIVWFRRNNYCNRCKSAVTPKYPYAKHLLYITTIIAMLAFILWQF